MDVFHYIAERLNGVELFEGVQENSIPPGGSTLNDIDRNPNNSGIWRKAEERITVKCTEEIISINDLIPESLLEEMFLAADETDKTRWHYNHALFDAEGDVNSFPYQYKVFKLVTIGMFRITLNMEDEKRYEIRYKCNWQKPDTFYEAHLLTSHRRRDAFSNALFEERFPKWQDLNTYYTENPDAVAKSTIKDI